MATDKSVSLTEDEATALANLVDLLSPNYEIRAAEDLKSLLSEECGFSEEQIDNLFESVYSKLVPVAFGGTDGS